jgi:hypothetical protein
MCDKIKRWHDIIKAIYCCTEHFRAYPEPLPLLACLASRNYLNTLIRQHDVVRTRWVHACNVTAYRNPVTLQVTDTVRSYELNFHPVLHGVTVSCKRYTLGFPVCYGSPSDVFATSNGFVHLYTVWLKKMDTDSLFAQIGDSNDKCSSSLEDETHASQQSPA